MTHKDIAHTGSAFHPPKLTQKINQELIKMFWDGTVIVGEVDKYVSIFKKKDIDAIQMIISKFKELTHALLDSFFVKSENANIITPYIWSLLKDYRYYGMVLAEQTQKFLEGDKYPENYIGICRVGINRSFSSENKILQDFFSQDPYIKK